jgi:hypothetical protein
MRLQPGCLRELHWHSTAAELGYVVSGSCRTTILSPDGAATDTFGPGDVWYFPRGWGHSIRGIGSSECHFILIFDDGAFAEDHTLSITDWLAHTSPAVVSQSLGLGTEWTALESTRCAGCQFRPATNGRGNASQGEALYRAPPRCTMTSRCSTRSKLSMAIDGLQETRRSVSRPRQFEGRLEAMPVDTTGLPRIVVGARRGAIDPTRTSGPPLRAKP